MRNGQNKRMRGRNRNNKPHHGGGGGGGGGGGHHHNPLTRVYESNGQEVKIRGTAHTIAEKYLQLARDATTSGDHVTAENHYQHAEHYYRLIATAQEQFRQQNPYYQPQQPMPGTEVNNEGSFEDGEDDGQSAQGQPQQGQPMQGQPMQGGQQPNNYNQQNAGNPQQSYPPREQSQPNYDRQQPQHQPRQQQPNYNNNQQPNYQPQTFAQPQPQPVASVEGDAGGLPSFITGGQPPQPVTYGPNGQNAPNGHDDNNQGSDRFPRHRRRRPRGPGGPRPEGGTQDFQGDGGSDGPAN